MPNMIFTADIHLRDTPPKCRTDDFIEEQWRKFEYVTGLCEEHKAVWFDCGDLLHKAYPSLELIAQMLKVLNGRAIYTLFGNHDMPYHNQNKIWEAGLGVLYQAKAVRFLDRNPKEIDLGGREYINVYGWPYGDEFSIETDHEGINILVHHGMIYEGRRDVLPGVGGYTAKQFLKKYNKFDLIVTGHNHKPFEVEYDGRVLVNVGCLTRQAADFAEHEPRVLLVRGAVGKGFTYEFLPIPAKSGVVSTAHLRAQAKKEEELNAFVEGLQGVEEASLSFQKNVETIINKTNPDKLTKQKVEEAIRG